jgi:hypothetical protein
MQSRLQDSTKYANRRTQKSPIVWHNLVQSFSAASVSVEDTGKTRLGGAYRLPNRRKAER